MPLMTLCEGDFVRDSAGWRPKRVFSRGSEQARPSEVPHHAGGPDHIHLTQDLRGDAA